MEENLVSLFNSTDYAGKKRGYHSRICVEKDVRFCEHFLGSAYQANATTQCSCGVDSFFIVRSTETGPILLLKIPYNAVVPHQVSQKSPTGQLIMQNHFLSCRTHTILTFPCIAVFLYELTTPQDFLHFSANGHLCNEFCVDARHLLPRLIFQFSQFIRIHSG